MKALRHAQLEDAIEVYVDGGVRHGADVYKALALGAKAVGVGRPVMYALASHGEAGVTKCMNLLANELHTAMMLMGTPTIADINESTLDTSELLRHAPNSPSAHRICTNSKL